MKINERSVLAQNLIKLRKKRNLTQTDLAKLSGVTRRMIAYYETKALEPSLQKIEAIANALDVKIEELTKQNRITNNEKKELEEIFMKIDARTLKKIKQILILPSQQRHKVYEYVDLLSSKITTKKAS